MTSRLHALVSGRVQGVAFRWFVEKQAIRLGLRGWVRNRFDGRVEVVAEGERPDLEELLGRLREGPSLSRVGSVQIEWEESRAEFPDFRTAPSA
jgi:acylphosphatase